MNILGGTRKWTRIRGGLLSSAAFYFSPAHSLFLLLSALFLCIYSPHGSRGPDFAQGYVMAAARPPETRSLSAWPVGTRALPESIPLLRASASLCESYSPANGCLH